MELPLDIPHSNIGRIITIFRSELPFDIPHSNIGRIITIFRSILYKKTRSEIRFFPFRIRKKLIERRTKAKWLQNCTLAVDIPKSMNVEIKKVKKLPYHFCCDFLYRIGYVSKYRSPIEYDGTGLKKEKLDLKER